MFKNDTNFLDQHFLIDNKILDLFIKEIDANKNDTIVEIGPGKGTITKIIAPLSKKLIVIEKDERLKEYLNSIDNIDLIFDSVLNVNIPKCNKIVTSLPYSITEPFIYKLIDTEFDKLLMICGNTYVKNVINNNTKLGILTNLYFDHKLICNIDPTSFDPKPRVLSSLITLTPKSINELSYNELVLRHLYEYRYMKVKNALKEIIIKLDNTTQRLAKEKVKTYNIPSVIEDKLFDDLSNEEMIILKSKIA